MANLEFRKEDNKKKEACLSMVPYGLEAHTLSLNTKLCLYSNK